MKDSGTIQVFLPEGPLVYSVDAAANALRIPNQTRGSRVESHRNPSMPHGSTDMACDGILIGWSATRSRASQVVVSAALPASVSAAIAVAMCDGFADNRSTRRLLRWIGNHKPSIIGRWYAKGAARAETPSTPSASERECEQVPPAQREKLLALQRELKPTCPLVLLRVRTARSGEQRVSLEALARGPTERPAVVAGGSGNTGLAPDSDSDSGGLHACQGQGISPPTNQCSHSSHPRAVLVRHPLLLGPLDAMSSEAWGAPMDDEARGVTSVTLAGAMRRITAGVTLRSALVTLGDSRRCLGAGDAGAVRSAVGGLGPGGLVGQAGAARGSVPLAVACRAVGRALGQGQGHMQEGGLGEGEGGGSGADNGQDRQTNRLQSCRSIFSYALWYPVAVVVLAISVLLRVAVAAPLLWVLAVDRPVACGESPTPKGSGSPSRSGGSPTGPSGHSSEPQGSALQRNAPSARLQLLSPTTNASTRQTRELPHPRGAVEETDPREQSGADEEKEGHSAAMAPPSPAAEADPLASPSPSSSVSPFSPSASPREQQPNAASEDGQEACGRACSAMHSGPVAPMGLFLVQGTAVQPCWPFPLASRSFFAQQLRRRLEGACRVPSALRKSQRLEGGWMHPRVGAEHLLRVRGQMGAFLLDVALGWVLVACLAGWPQLASHATSGLRSIASLVAGRPVTDTLRWLMGIPGGLKLNHRAGRWLGLLAVRVMAWWGGVLGWVLQGGTRIVWVLACVGASGGLTLSLAALVDMLRVAALPLMTLQWVCGRAVHSLQWLLYSLALALQGRKRNVLRQRTDSLHLGTPQLLVAALAFTAALLFLPTPVVYHVFCALIALGIRAVTVAAGLASAVVDAAPLLNLALYWMRPSVFQAGAWMEGVRYSGVQELQEQDEEEEGQDEHSRWEHDCLAKTGGVLLLIAGRDAAGRNQTHDKGPKKPGPSMGSTDRQVSAVCVSLQTMHLKRARASVAAIQRPFLRALGRLMVAVSPHSWLQVFLQGHLLPPLPSPLSGVGWGGAREVASGGDQRGGTGGGIVQFTADTWAALWHADLV